MQTNVKLYKTWFGVSIGPGMRQHNLVEFTVTQGWVCDHIKMVLRKATPVEESC